MKQQKIKTISMPMCIQLQNGSIQKSNFQELQVVCESNRLIINLSKLQVLHPLEVNAIIDIFTNQVGKSFLFDYLLIEGEIESKVADAFAKTVGTRLFDTKVRKLLVGSMINSYPDTLTPLWCVYNNEQLPSPNNEPDIITRFTFYRNN